MKPDVTDLGPRCLVCGHYHGGHGGCVIAHAFVAAKDCQTCVRDEKRREEAKRGS